MACSPSSRCCCFSFFNCAAVIQKLFDALIFLVPLLLGQRLAVDRHEPINLQRFCLARGKQLLLAIFVRKFAVTPQGVIFGLRAKFVLEDIANESV